MTARNQTVTHWPLIFTSMGMVILLLACAPAEVVTGTPAAVATETEAAGVRLEHGAVEVQSTDQAWIPVTGETTFELVGILESTDPWMVTGNTFAVRESTQIAEGLEAGDRVRVRGVILEDATWLASSMERLDEQLDPTVTLIGRVNSINPWVVNGIPLVVEDDTIIAADIHPDMLVRVDILLAEDGTWQVLSIAPIEDVTEIPGCASVRAIVQSVNGKEVAFEGWPVITLSEETRLEEEDGSAATLSPHQSVLVLICATEAGEFVIARIIVLDKSTPEPDANTGKALICHKPDKKGGHTLRVAEPAVSAHLAHGDTLGPCP